ncbi:MAG: hypothetical protein WCP12_09890, partial [bacterium]
MIFAIFAFLAVNYPHTAEKREFLPQRTQRKEIDLCDLCVPCGELFWYRREEREFFYHREHREKKLIFAIYAF